MIVGGLRALRQTDLKLLLAFGTVSQLGFITVLFGLGPREAVGAGCVLLLAHALLKPALFMTVGMSALPTGPRHILQLPAPARRSPPVAGVADATALPAPGLPHTTQFT